MLSWILVFVYVRAHFFPQEFRRWIRKKAKQRVLQRFKDEYMNGIIQRSILGKHHAHCRLCGNDFSIGHGGKFDVEKHMKTRKHIELARLTNSNTKVTSYLQQSSSADLNTINAEVLFTEFLIEHGLPLAVADHVGPLFKRMFPDSKIAEKYACARTKSSHIVRCLAEDSSLKIAEAMKIGPFSIATDGSCDYDDKKLYPVCVRYFDSEKGKVMSVLLSLPELTVDSTGQNIFDLLDNVLKKHDISWQNCMGFAADNASVMTGIHKGVASYILKMSPSVFITGCPCHLMHLAADKLEVDIGHLLIDIYYYLEKNSKRKQALKLLQDQFDLEDYKVIKHVCTRWLSLGKCVSRLLELWDALQAFFQTESESAQRKHGGKVKKSGTKAESVIASQKRTRDESIDRHTNNKEIGVAERKKFKSMEFLFERPLSIQLEGLQAQTMTVKDKSFDIKSHQPSGSGSSEYKSVKKHTGSSHTSKGKTSKVDTKMAQKEKESVHCFEDSKCEMVYKKLNDPVTKLYCLFMKSAIPLFDAANVLQKEEPCIHIMHKILSNQLSDLLIRFIKPEIITSAKLLTDIDFHDHANQKDNEDLAIGAEAREFIEHNSTLPVKMFYDNVRDYYATACDYMLNKFPYGDELLLNASVADVNERQSKSFKSVRFFVKRYPFLLPPLSNLDHLEEEFLKYQVGILPDNILNADRVDVQWHLISQLKDSITGRNKFPLLCQVMKGILVLYHSNADCERLFSVVNKNKTEFRSRLSNPVMSALLVCKTFMASAGTKCFEMQHDNLLLSKAKSATYEHLNH